MTQYTASYTIDGISWNLIDNGRIFNANTDTISRVKNDLFTKVVARAVRIHPYSWVAICLRLDVLLYDF